jgi:hypothetical protein
MVACALLLWQPTVLGIDLKEDAHMTKGTIVSLFLIGAMITSPALALAQAGGAGGGAGAGSGAGGTGAGGTGAAGASGTGASGGDASGAGSGPGGTSAPGASGQGRSSSEMPPAATSPSRSISSPSASPSSGDYMGRHTMSGEVTQIDHTKGTFTLKTPEGTMDLHAPASALAGVNKGDHMSVEIAVKPMK